jgi:uncharacterized protein YkuJ
MVYSILSEARVRHSVAPKQPDVIQYQVVWDTNMDLKDWTTFVNMDIVGAWGGFLFSTKRTQSNSFIGPSNDFPAVDALVNDRIFFRMKYDKHPNSIEPTTWGKITWTTTADPLFDEPKTQTFEVIADGRWHLYEINMGENPNWVGEINRVRFFPCEDGFVNDEFFLGFFEIGTSAFDFSFDAADAGTAGFAEAGSPILGSVLIEKDVNDKLIVDIDGYGDVQITLTPQEVTGFMLARDISLQLGKVAVGGYSRAEAYLTDDQKIRIESGTRASDSSVTVKDGPNSAGRDLGLLDDVGFFIGISGAGTDPAVGYEPLSAYRPTTLEILAMFDNDDSLAAFALDPQQAIVQSGNINFDTVHQRLKTEVIFEGRDTGLQGQKFSQETPGLSASTFIDLNHPFSDEGKVDRIFMNGSPDRNGGSKWKIFRPSLDGTLTLVKEGVIGQKDFTDDPNGGLVGSPSPDVFVADVSTADVFVRRGDLLGIYNVGLHSGSGNSIKPDALYYQIAGDVTGTVVAPQPSGAGEAGLPIYAHGFQTKNRAVIDIDLRRRLNIDKVRVTGEEDRVNLEYNLGIATSAIYNADTEGQHTVCYSPSPTLRFCVERQNEGFNIQALNDGIRLAENGVAAFGDGGPSGQGGATAPGATYFYVNGDSEFFNVYEFVNQAPESYDFQRDGVGLECFFSNQTPRLDKPVGKVIMYFKDKKNQRSWGLEYLVGQGGKGGNGTKPGFSFIPEDTIQYVKIDEQRFEALPPFSTLKPSASAELLLANPTRFDTIAADGTVNPQKGVDYVDSVEELGGVNYRDQVSFIEAQWNIFEWGFDAIRTPAIRWYSDYHWSTKISEMEVYGVSESDESLADNIQVFFSSDGELFASGDIINANEKEAEFKVGNSPQYMRFIVRPTLQTAINDIKVDFEEDQVCFGEEGRIQGSTFLKEARVGATTGGTTFSGIREPTPIKFSNSMGQTADLIVDIPEDIETAKQLLYFNQLNSAEDIQAPQIGAPGRVDFVDDKILEEETSVMMNAKAYGLISLVSGTDSFRSPNLSVNGGFATGDLTGWELDVINSGTQSYQIPRVDDFSGSTTASIQGGSYSFGTNMDDTDPITQSQFPRQTFRLSQNTDISAYADSVDQGAARADWNFRYIDYHTGNTGTFRLMGSPTLSGIEEPPGHIVDPEYGSNILASIRGQESSSHTTIIQFGGDTIIKRGTRYLRLDIYVDATGAVNSNPDRLIWHMDAYTLYINAPAVTLAKWYKSYFTGVKDYTDAAYEPVDPSLYTTITGSDHWYQPARQNATTAPIAGQSQGFSQGVSQNRNQGVQAFSRMTTTNPGILGVQWEGERQIGGIRVAHHQNTNSSCVFTQNYPRLWDIEVLKTEAELGQPPDANMNDHWKVVRRVTARMRDNTPSQLQTYFANYGGAHSKQYTFVFPDGPVPTEGVRIVYTQNCDFFERSQYPGGFSGWLQMQQVADCPGNQFFITDFASSRGIYSSMFTPLESVGRNTLPVDNTVDRELTPGVAECGGTGGTVYVAVDLGRHFDVETNSDLFELISQTLTQTPWTTTPNLWSADDTDDPNQVDWTGGSQFARWIRFTSTGEEEYEKEQVSNSGGNLNAQSPYRINNLPQAILLQARVYPRLQTSHIPVEGPNHFWEDLGPVLTDNKNTTFINYSDYPVVCFDLNRPYKLKQTSAATVLRRDLISPGPVPATDDKLYWNENNDDSYAYPVNAAKGANNPENVEYSDWGGSLPTTGIRWVAIRGVENLLQSDGSNTPRQWNFGTQGGTLFGVTFAPEENEVFTENSNWFVTRQAGLVDISTFDTSQGNLFSLEEGVDYGASHNSSDRGTLGDPYNVWDGIFDPIDNQDYWSVFERDSVSGFVLSGNDFPHYVWRVFKDPYRGDILTQEVKAITILGFDDNYYPTDFQIQTLTEGADPNLNTSWTTIDQSTFVGVDSYQEGIGYTHIWPVAIETTGIRVYITNSVYPPDDSNTLDELNQASQNTDRLGFETRLVSVTIFSEESREAVLEGTIDTNHAWGSTATSLTSVPERGPEFLVDNNLRTYFQSTGFEDEVTIKFPSGPKPISRFEWEMDEDYAKQVGPGLVTNCPATFKLKANSLLSGYETVISETEFSGISYSGTINPPVTADEWIMEIESVQGQDENANSIIMHELRLIEEQEQSEPLVVMSDVFDRRPGSPNQRSTQITYAKNSNAVANVVLDGIDANNDEFFSERDFFSFWVWINDISLLDTSFGTIRIGNNRETSYTWEISTLNLTSGWNELRLQFRNAADRAEIPFQSGPNYSLDTGLSKVDFITPDAVITTSVDGNYSRNIVEGPGIRYFELEFRGVDVDRELVLYLDDMRFIRNRFDDVCRFTPSLYLNNSETFTIYTDGLDISTGTIEFWFQPDWDTTARVDKSRDIVPSIFKILRPDGKYMTFFYRPSVGFITIVNDRKRLYRFQTRLRHYSVNRYEPMHIAVVWDTLGRIGATGSTLQVYINGETVYGTTLSWDAIREGGATLMFGGEVGQGIAATPHNETATTFTAVPTLPQDNTASSWASLENIKIYNYAKTNFDDRNDRELSRTQLLKPSEMLEISLDNTTWHGVGSDSLPLVVPGVESGQEGTVYVRSNIPKDITGDENRDASLLVRWKTPLVNCD